MSGHVVSGQSLEGCDPVWTCQMPRGWLRASQRAVSLADSSVCVVCTICGASTGSVYLAPCQSVMWHHLGNINHVSRQVIRLATPLRSSPVDYLITDKAYYSIH